MQGLMRRARLIDESEEETLYEMELARRQAIRAMVIDLESAERKGSMSEDTYQRLHASLIDRREENDRRLHEMLEATPTLNCIEFEMEASHLRALEKQIYRDLEKEGDLNYDSMELLVREVVERREAEKRDQDDSEAA